MSESVRDRFRKLLGSGRAQPDTPAPPARPAARPAQDEPQPPAAQPPAAPPTRPAARPAQDEPQPPATQPAHTPARPPAFRPSTPASPAGSPPSLTDRVRPPEPKPAQPSPPRPSPPPAEPARQTPPAPPQPMQPGGAEALPASASDARLFLQQLRGKMARLAEEFAQGKVNRKQFEEIYQHYQQQRNIIEAALYDMPGSETWRDAVASGQTALLRQRHAGKVLSYAIYDNASGMPLASVGDFSVDTALLVPMLSSFRSATAEIFGAGLRSTEIEGGRWLCFVPGRYTTLFVIFSIEPARMQLILIEDLHRDFEVANRTYLESGEGEEVAQRFTRLWALDRMVL